MITHAEIETRLRCIELALREGHGARPLIDRARDIYDFVSGDMSPRDAIDAALDRAGVR
jgi:hypothetical protein